MHLPRIKSSGHFRTCMRKYDLGTQPEQKEIPVSVDSIWASQSKGICLCVDLGQDPYFGPTYLVHKVLGKVVLPA